MATAIPERASGVRDASLPCLIRSVDAGIGDDRDVDRRALLRSAALSSAAVPQVIASLCPELFSNFGPRHRAARI